MGKAERRKKDSAMAAYMQKHYIIRTTTACPHCHNSTGLGDAMLRHINVCRGRSRVNKRLARIG